MPLPLLGAQHTATGLHKSWCPMPSWAPTRPEIRLQAELYGLLARQDRHARRRHNGRRRRLVAVEGSADRLPPADHAVGSWHSGPLSPPGWSRKLTRIPSPLERPRVAFAGFPHLRAPGAATRILGLPTRMVALPGAPTLQRDLSGPPRSASRRRHRVPLPRFGERHGCRRLSGLRRWRWCDG